MHRDAYLETEVLSASPLYLVALLYRGAINACRSAIGAIETGDIRTRNAQITRAQAIIGELSGALDHQQGGDLSRDLSELYAYIQDRLVKANYEQRSEPLRECVALLQTLAEGWNGIAGSTGSTFGNMERNQGTGQVGGIGFEASRLDQLA